MNRETLLLPPFYNWTVNVSINNEASSFDSGSGGQGDLKGAPRDLDPLSPGSDSKDWGSCRDWQDAQHTLFQLANLCAAISLLTPSSFRHHLLFLRCLLLIAFLFFVLWAGLFVCMLDVLIWNCVFFLVDLIHIICLAYNNIPSRFNPTLNDLYARKFKPLKVFRKEFAELCAIAQVVNIRQSSKYALEEVTPCGEKVSVLVRGRMKVSHGNTFLHLVEANEFVDSLEFDSVPLHVETSEKFQVTIIAVEDSLLLSWQYPNLRAFLASNPFVWTVFTSLVGKDISDKLYRIQEFLIKDPDSMTSPLSTPCPTPCHSPAPNPHLHSPRCDASCRSYSFPRPPCHGNGKTQYPSAFLSHCTGAFTPPSPRPRQLYDKHYSY